MVALLLLYGMAICLPWVECEESPDTMESRDRVIPGILLFRKKGRVWKVQQRIDRLEFV